MINYKNKMDGSKVNIDAKIFSNTAHMISCSHIYLKLSIFIKREIENLICRVSLHWKFDFAQPDLLSFLGLPKQHFGNVHQYSG